MKADTFANRLKRALSENNLNQTKLARETNIDKSLINKYIKGISEPGNDKLSKIAEVLNINEVWLMGYDIEVEPKTDSKDLLEQYQNLLAKDTKLTSQQKEYILEYIKTQYKNN